MNKLIASLSILTIILAGCSSSEPVAYHGESVVEDAEKGNTTYTVDFMKDESGDITGTDFEAVSEDGTTRTSISESGGYGMNDEDGDGVGDEGTNGAWHEQVASLEAYVDENDAFPTLTDNGEGKKVDADAVSGATIGLGDFEAAFLAAQPAE